MSGTLPAGIPAAAENWRRRALAANAGMLRSGLRELGCDTAEKGPSCPGFIGERDGVFASAVRFPAVAKGEAIVRFMLMASHTEEHIRRTIAACANALPAMRNRTEVRRLAAVA